MTIFLQPTPTSKSIAKQKNMFWWYFNMYLKTLNAYDSKLLFCDLVTFSSKPFNLHLSHNNINSL